MPRIARQRSSTGIYHIMVRGNNKKDIFLNQEDKAHFIKSIIKAKSRGGFNLLSYVIMDNHAHLLIQETAESISTVVKRINTSYAAYFNKFYGRVGHVFQDRFKSEKVEDISYLLTVVNYIHNNPEKAGICMKHEYQWSSFGDISRQDKSFVDSHIFLNLAFEGTEDKCKSFLLHSIKKTGKAMDVEDFKWERTSFVKVKEVVENFKTMYNYSMEELKEKSNSKEVKMLIRYLHLNLNASICGISECLRIGRYKIKSILQA